MNISILFTIIFIIFYLILTIITIKARKSTKVAYGDDGNKELIKAVRAHGNFFEFTVFFIISSFLLEILDANQIYVFIYKYYIFTWLSILILHMLIVNIIFRILR